MKKSIFRSICVAAAAVFLATLVVIIGALFEINAQEQKKEMNVQLSLAAQGVEHEGIAYFDGFSLEDNRITWIDSDGNVLYDNETAADSMDNHLDRIEIRQALQSGYGESSRYSSTLMQRQLYSAQRLTDGTVIRISGTRRTILSLILIMFQPILLVLIIALAISLWLASKLSKKIVEPLNRLDLDAPSENTGYEELKPLLDRIERQQILLRAQSGELARKREEFTAATANMKEGLVLLNENGIILSINNAAAELLSLSTYCIGKDILLVNHSLELQELLRKARGGEHSEMTLRIKGADYQLNASPVITDGTVAGIAILIFDITEKEKAELMRREFTANVSHELRSPLQSISGYAELLKNNMVREADTPRFYDRIYAEAQRMITLVDDIIGLSRMDEAAADAKREEVDLSALAQETIRILQPMALEKGVTLSVSGDAAPVTGVPALLNGIVYNLVDNAIKYNRRGGSVSVSVDDQTAETVLTVSDTGIGIAPEERERIFERFYRVDKSHSKALGGTGLGLSIVKHAAKVHNAKIELNSVIDGGTSVTVRFPKNI